MSKVFRSANENFQALQDVQVAIQPGEFVSLLGPSGCGKTTLLQILAGLVTPTEGIVAVFGEAPKAGRRDIGIMFQTTVLLPWRTVLENVVLPLKLFGMSKRERYARAREVLKLVQLDEFSSAYPWQLSGGMQQRVALARVLAYHPRTLLMDEPFSALDELTRERLNLEFSRLNAREEPATVVLVTHSIEEAVTLSDRILIMASDPGRVVAEIQVDLPQPRTPAVLQDGEFTRAAQEARRVITRTWA